MLDDWDLWEMMLFIKSLIFLRHFRYQRENFILKNALVL